jgi:replicative DNA helicase
LKISKNGLLLLTIGILIIVFANLSAMHSQQVNGQNELNDELDMAMTRVSKLQLEQFTADKEKLEQQLSQIMDEIDAEKSVLSPSVTSIDLSDKLLGIADENMVTIKSISSGGVMDEEMDGIIYSALPITLEAEGGLFKLRSFIYDLNDELATGTVKSVDIAVAESTDYATARINLIVYAYLSTVTAQPVKVAQK